MLDRVVGDRAGGFDDAIEITGLVTSPFFFLLGEMRCGTTTLYRLLGEHPAIALPSRKEPRYLTLPNYRHRTGSWYASHFRAAAAAPDRLTLDASPTMFNA